ncbi:MAG: ABC transporter ATP-binding protein [Candidatus Makaraimicrobium thalassicum]|nr:MAG: ABC transporter ATP-binding protein [Candidatus Omnitrophota bacterium]
MTKEKILEVKDLTVTIDTRRVIDNVSFDLYPGQVMALVGESGSGKTLTALSILDLLPVGAVREKGEIRFRGKNIFELAPEEIRKIRGDRIAMVFQEPFTAMNPVMRAGVQITETIIAHKSCSAPQASGRLEELLDMVKLSREAARRYPHELSGGMRQRLILAMALACGPDVLILDEPTTALDVSTQKQILDLIKRIQEEGQYAVLFITHDFSVVNTIADKVCVMRQGLVMERGTRDEVLRYPRHPYTRQLIDCIPRLGDRRQRLPAQDTAQE